MKTYNEFTISSDPFLPDIISGIFWEINILGITEEDNMIKVFADDSNITLEIIKNLLNRLIDENIIKSFSVDSKKLESKNWNEEWEKNLKPIRITNKLIIKPSSYSYKAKGNEIVIVIDPKMSFGTGEHHTTRLMLQCIQQYVKEEMKVLDVGSGTAVLAIASVKFGAVKAIAVDNDELCLHNGYENIKMNNVENFVEVRFGELKDISENNFDLILANIQKNVLIEIVDEISEKIKQNGLVILSGLLSDDEDDIVKIYSKSGFELIEKQQMNEWIALVFKMK